MSNKSGQALDRVFSALIVVLAIGAFTLAGYNWVLRRTLAGSPVGPVLEYGDQLEPELLSRGLKWVGYEFDPKIDRYLLFYFFRPDHFRHLESVKYGEVLFERHSSKGLKVFGVTDASASQIQSLRTTESLRLPVLVDKDEMLRAVLRVPEPYEHTFLVTAAGEVLFSASGSPQEDLMRQVIEKYVVGKIAYGSVEAEQVFRVGDKFPAVRVAPLGRGPNRSLEVRDEDVVLISARCTSCQLNRFVEHFRSIIGTREAKAIGAVVFSGRFSKQELISTLSQSNIPLKDVYIALEALGGLDNEYNTKDYDEAAIRLHIDPNGIVSDVKPFDRSH